MINDLKDLERLFKLCRKQGIAEFAINGITFKLGDLPVEQSKHVTIEDEITDPYKNFPQGELTPEQLMYYSSGGLPDEDPENRDRQQ